jgi:DNA-binding IscR family transcriptional regulator
LLLRHSVFGAKKGKGGGYYLIKDPGNQYGKVYRILERSFVALC